MVRQVLQFLSMIRFLGYLVRSKLEDHSENYGSSRSISSLGRELIINSTRHVH